STSDYPYFEELMRRMNETFAPLGVNVAIPSLRVNEQLQTVAALVTTDRRSGLTLAPEGGAHQSIHTPLIGMAQDKLTYFEPAFVDELAAIMAWGFGFMQSDSGGSVYLRLATRPLSQPQRALTPELRAAIIAGGYWLFPPAPDAELAIVYAGAVAEEAIAAHREILDDIPGAGLLAVTSPDRLHSGWLAAATVRRSGQPAPAAAAETLLAPLAPRAGLVTIIDGHPAALSWLGAVRGQATHALGVEHFGQSGDIPDLYRAYGLDTEAIIAAVAQHCVSRLSSAR
ncbi:MAG: hypothetical protein HY246_25070, partial [Proteobacteria bacterium]|nr:hypothetical protein [Pseudomonadota bacterium]